MELLKTLSNACVKEIRSKILFTHDNACFQLDQIYRFRNPIELSCSDVPGSDRASRLVDFPEEHSAISQYLL